MLKQSIFWMGARLLKLLKSNLLILILIILLGLFLRVYDLNSVPPGLTWDEAALGYNAYSILNTGKDEYGVFLPLTLKSFGDYKPALYSYIDIPFIFLFGLNETVVRIPSLLSGVGLIILAYLLVRKIFNNNWLGLSAALFIAISPPAIIFSRAAWEANMALFLNVLGLYLFLKAFGKPYFYYICTVIFSLSLICYQASKIFLPIIFIGLFLFFRKEIKYSKAFIISFVFLVLVLGWVFFSTFFLGQSDRLAVQNFFAYRRADERIERISEEDGLYIGSPEFEILHGEWWAFGRGLVERYIIYFSPKTLFIEGDYSPRHNVPDLGIFSFYGLLFIPLGFYFLWRRNEQERKIIFFWLFVSTIPAVLSRDLISMVRALNFIFPIALLEAFGFYFLVKKLSSILRLKEFLVTASLLILVFINLFLFLDFYFIHLKRENSQGWMYGYKQVFEKGLDFSKYDKVVFNDKYGQPYIYYLFYSKYPPEKFQQQAKLEQNSVDVGTVRQIDNIEFRPIFWPKDRGSQNSLFIGEEFSLPEQDLVTEKKTRKLFEINFLNGEKAFKVVENGYEN